MNLISAADIEKFAYCPLSWWLSWKDKTIEPAEMRNGAMRHEDISRSVAEVRRLESLAVTSERLVLWFAVIATVIAMLGVELLYENQIDIAEILVIISLIWIIAALYYLRLAFGTPVKDKRMQYEKVILVFAIVAAVIAVNSVFMLQVDRQLAVVLEALSLVWLIGASYFLQRSLLFSQAARLLKRDLHVDGEIEYVDSGPSELMVSKKYGISGKPDYILKTGGKSIPVEEKTGRMPKGPLFSHILQVAAYCLILEEKLGEPVPYGILKYGADQHVIEFDDMLRKTLLEKISEMRTIVEGKTPPHRNHNRPGKCAHCSRNSICPERLG
ncbi:MAG: CRISPR-associated protein Cas4 [Thermoplasmata archaeon]